MIASILDGYGYTGRQSLLLSAHTYRFLNGSILWFRPEYLWVGGCVAFPVVVDESFGNKSYIVRWAFTLIALINPMTNAANNLIVFIFLLFLFLI